MLIKPQLAQDAVEILIGDEWGLEPKWDGIRLLCHIYEAGDAENPRREVAFWTRNGNPKFLPRVAAAIKRSGLPTGTWLDGEMACLTGRWNEAQSGVQSGHDERLTYIVFDIPSFDGLDTTGMPYSARRALLAKLFEKVDLDECVRLTPVLEATVGNYNLLLDTGFEGAMFKRKTGHYHPGKRTGDWRKRKTVSTLDAIITGYEPGKDVGTILFSQYDAEGNLVPRGRCKALKGVHRDVERRIAGQQVVEIKFNGIMRSGALRHPQIFRIREDKIASECRV